MSSHAVVLLFFTRQKAKAEPVRGVPSELLLIDKSGEKLYIATATFYLLLKSYGILEDQCSVFVGEFWYLGRDGKVFGITGCLNT